VVRGGLDAAGDGAHGAAEVTLDLRDAGTTAAAVIAALGLSPHPEGGHYREVWRDAPAGGGRGAGTAIHFLLETGERSRWHRVDAAELWLWQGGGPLVLSLSERGACVDREVTLGPDLGAGQATIGVVPAGWWQAARPASDRWCLVACTVSPAFEFSGFELASPGWEPGR
jgi:predicted cupin superfamily sugar epimerase